MKVCPSCNTQSNPAAFFCSNKSCGKAFPEVPSASAMNSNVVPIACYRCGMPNAPEITFCGNCGSDLKGFSGGGVSGDNGYPCPKCGMKLTPGYPCSNSHCSGFPNPGKGLSIAGMVLGIVGIVFVFTGIGAFIGIICSLVGLILSIQGRKKTPPNVGKGMATAGIVTSAIVLGICSLVFVIFLLGILAVASTPMLLF